MYYKLGIKENRLRNEIIQRHIKYYWILFFIVYLAFLSPADVIGQSNVESYKVFNEMRISSKEMSCNYSMEGFRILDFSFEYPKIIITERQNPIVAFIDENSNKLVFVEINGQHAKIISKIDSFREEIYRRDRWPFVFYHQNEINLAVLAQEHQKKKEPTYHFQIYALNADENRLELRRDIHMKKDENTLEIYKQNASLEGIFPLSATKHILFGRFTDFHFHPGGLISGDFPKFTKTFSLIWDGDKIGQYQKIEKDGWFGAVNNVYVGTSGVIHCAWVRDTSRVSFSSKHTKTVCYSVKKNNSRWTEPIELYEIETTEYTRIQNLSISCNKSKTYIVWEDKIKGVYFAEIGADDKKIDKSQIKQLSSLENGATTHWGLSRLKIVADQKGDVFVVWIESSWTRTSRTYRVIFRARIDDKWLPSNIVSEGEGLAQQCDIEIDKNENIHITYIKQNPRDSYGCYYLRLSPLSVKRE